MAKINKAFQWAVIGAGPAGIAAVGKLLDYHILPEDILWVDPHFKVGDLGLLWHNVSSNTVVKRFLNFLHAANSFTYKKALTDFPINHLPPDHTCVLNHIVEPLQWVTSELNKQVISESTIIHSMKLKEQTWFLSSTTRTFKAKNVILATGALPSTLNHPGVDMVPFEIAIDFQRLKQFVDPNHTYAVFGSSHSAIIIIRYLVELGVHRIINFYRSPCRYAVDMGEWILFDNTGLKGQTAAWAKEYIDGKLPPNLVRYPTNEHNVGRFLAECNKVIYAVGFERRNSIIIDDYEEIDCNPHVGIIGPGLFGLGIGYPELKADPFGYYESQVGLWKFMLYLDKVMPVWLKYPT